MIQTRSAVLDPWTMDLHAAVVNADDEALQRLGSDEEKMGALRLRYGLQVLQLRQKLAQESREVIQAK